MTVKFSQERKVRSLAKKTLGSTRVGRAMRFVEEVVRRGAEDMVDAQFGIWFGISVRGVVWSWEIRLAGVSSWFRGMRWES